MDKGQPIIPKEWRKTKMDDLFDISNGLWIGKTNDRLSCRVLRNTNFNNDGSTDLLNVATLEVDKRSLKSKELRYGDILIEKSGGSDKQPVGRVIYFALNETGYSFSNFTSRIRARDDVNSKYLFYVLYYIWASGKTHSLQKQTTGIRNLDFSAYKNLDITLPPKCEQEKIAEILSTVDEEIRKTDEIISSTEKLKVGLMRELFTKGIGHTKFKRTKIGELPEEWDAVLLDSVAKRGSGHTPNKQHPEYWNGGIKWVSLSDSKKLDSRYIVDTDKEISMEGIKNSSAVLHPKETIVICRDAAIGKVAILGLDDMAVSQHFIAWQCGKNVYSTYLYYLLQSWKARFEQIATGTTIKTIGLPFFKSLHIPLPRINEQKEIGTILWSIDDKIQVYKKQRDTLTRLKNGLMQDLLSGNKIISI